MIFKKASSIEPVAAYLAATISTKLQNDKKVLWLVPGGSAMLAAAGASKAIIGVESSLFISLTDERPGKVGHDESNWKQLQEVGFNYSNREYYEVLQDRSSEEEVTNFDAWLEHTLEVCDYKIGLFGIGPDGHTAGILPSTPEKFGKPFVAFFDDGQRQRISITSDAIAKLDEAVIYISGEDKAGLIDLLQSDNDPITFPAEYLKAAGTLTIYNNWIGE
jgi:6-phosphogluconolactonase/glucosamine-6-phosphate isomerase/deaminase